MARKGSNDIIQAREARIKKDISQSGRGLANKADIEKVRTQLKKSGLDDYVIETTMIGSSVAIRYAKETPDCVKVKVGRSIRES